MKKSEINKYVSEKKYDELIELLQDEIDDDDEVVLYAFVNSLTELPNINKVQFMIDSETEISFGEHSYLNEPFERNLEIVEVK